MSVEKFWLGVAFAYLMPGSSVNIVVYYGAIIDGLRGAFLSWIFIYIPAFLSVYGILPQWSSYRDKPGVSRLLIGMNSVIAGFILAAVKNDSNLDINDARA
jgi:chromate transporter